MLLDVVANEFKFWSEAHMANLRLDVSEQRLQKLILSFDDQLVI